MMEGSGSVLVNNGSGSTTLHEAIWNLSAAWKRVVDSLKHYVLQKAIPYHYRLPMVWISLHATPPTKVRLAIRDPHTVPSHHSLSNYTTYRRI
jgi:hypothetical protein